MISGGTVTKRIHRAEDSEGTVSDNNSTVIQGRNNLVTLLGGLRNNNLVTLTTKRSEKAQSSHFDN